MRERATDAEIVYHLDEFLWEEEGLEFRVAERCFQSMVNSLDTRNKLTVMDSIINELPVSNDRTDSFTRLMALHWIFFGGLADHRSVFDVIANIRDTYCPEYNRKRLINKLTSQLYGLILFVESNQIDFVRDTFRMTLSRQSSAVSSNSGQFEPSILSSKIRICLNLLYLSILIDQHENWLQETVEQIQLHEVLITALRIHADNIIPIRKVVLFILKLLSLFARDSVIHIPNNTPGLLECSSTSPLSTLLGFVPQLSGPKLPDFRAFIALTLHQNSLMNWAPADGARSRPAAIEQAIQICDLNMIRFIESYRFSDPEIQLLRSDPSLLPAFQLYVQLTAERRVGRAGTTLLKPSKITSRFSVPELTKHMLSNYQITAANNDNSSDESDQDLPNLPLFHQAYLSSHSWLAPPGREEELIEAIAEAAVPIRSFSEPLIEVDAHNSSKSFEYIARIYNRATLQEILVVLLKLLLTSCRGATDPVLSPTNHSSFDLDRDHLLTVLERFEAGVSPPTHRESSMRRNYEIIACAITGILVLLLKLHPDESDFIQRTIVANNGCLVLLKQITSYPVDPIDIADMNAQSVFPELRSNKSWSMAIPPRLPTTLFRSLKALYILCKDSVPRIKKYLIHYKVAVVLKRFFNIPNVGILKMAYKLFKIQMRFLGKKWKFSHIKLLSCCYNATDLNFLDDWIVNDPDVMDIQGPADDLLNDSYLPTSPPHYEKKTIEIFNEHDYIEELRKLNFEKKEDTENFSIMYGDKPESFFGCKSLKSYQDWLLSTLGTH
jgi:hypothetical protein